MSSIHGSTNVAVKRPPDAKQVIALSKSFLLHQENPDIHYIGSGRAGYQEIIKGLEIGI